MHGSLDASQLRQLALPILNFHEARECSNLQVSQLIPPLSGFGQFFCACKS